MNSYARSLCIKCNENYGAEERKGMCSVCFKKCSEPTPVVEETIIPETKLTDPIVIPEISTESEITKPIQTNTMNCWVCNTKVGYLGFKCHCEYVFCGKHRHFSEHNCDFDYKKYDRSKLKAAIEGKKVK
jgi:hypothetical protein